MDIPTDVGQPNLDVSKTFFLKICHEYTVQKLDKNTVHLL